MSRRIEKVNELLIQEVAKYIKEVIEDPDFGLVTVMGADASPDLRSAKILVSVMGADPKRSLGVLNQNRFEIQRLLNRSLEMQHVPQIFFRLDETAKKAERLEKLFKKINQHSGNDNSD